MTVETEVANLVTAVDNLTSTVNVRQAVLDASVADAEGARDTALTYRDTTLTYKDQAEGHATTAAAEAANALSAVTWQDLAGLTFAFSKTLVDATVYDTTQDYDGGAWRFNKRASWYQEDRTTGTWLGEYADETAARAGGGTTGDCYYATGANLFYELSAGSGQTETTRAGTRRQRRVSSSGLYHVGGFTGCHLGCPDGRHVESYCSCHVYYSHIEYLAGRTKC